MRIAPLVTGLMLCSVLLFADELNVDFDRHTDFSTLKTFALREGKVNSANPELNNALVVRKIGDAIREGLIAKGLKETASNPDIIVDYSITGLDFSETRGGPAAFSQGTLVVDLNRRESKTLVWRSVYRDNESNNAKLAQKLPGDVKKSLAKYPPPKQKGGIEQSPSSTLVTRTTVSPREAAMAVLEIVNSTREDKAFVGPASPPGLEVNLTGP